MFPKGGDQSQSVFQIRRISRHIIGDDQGSSDVQIGIGCAGVIRNSPGKRSGEPRHQAVSSSIRCIAIRLAVNPKTIESVPVTGKQGNQHTISNTFRYRTATFIHRRTTCFINPAVVVGGSGPDNATSRQTLSNIRGKDFTKFSSPIRISGRFVFQCYVMEIFPHRIQRVRILGVCRSREPADLRLRPTGRTTRHNNRNRRTRIRIIPRRRAAV